MTVVDRRIKCNSPIAMPVAQPPLTPSRRRRRGKMSEPLIGGLISSSPVCLLSGGHRRLVAAFGKSLRAYLCDGDKQPRLTSGFHGHESGIASVVTVGPMRVASASNDGTVRVWGVEDGTLLRTIDCLRPVSDMSAISEQRVVIATDNSVSILRLDREVSPEVPPRMEVLTDLIPCKMRRVSASANGSVVAAVGGSNVVTLAYVKGERVTTVTFPCTYELTTVAISPDGNILAAGDVKGYIHVYKDVNRIRKKKDGGMHELSTLQSSDLHWHSHHVTALRFSKYGNILYSGGCEGVLLIWSMRKTDFGKRNFKPRLGGAIWGIALADDEATIVLTHADNSVRFIDTVSLSVTKTLRGLSTAHLRRVSPWELVQGDLAVPDNMNFVAEPGNSGCALVSGVGNIVQLYDVLQGANVADIKVDARNIVMSGNHSGDENTVEPPTVRFVTASCDRKYMVTITQDYHPISESRAAKEAVFIETLKFWDYNGGNGTVNLLSYIENPHGQKDRITDIHFHPVLPVVASISHNGTLKIWRAVTDEEDKEGIVKWRCEATEKYRDMHGGKLAFSADGSVLAASFGIVITIWALEDLVEAHALKTSKDQVVLSSAAKSINFTFLHTLIHSPKEETIGHLSFVKKDTPYLLATTCHSLYIWDVLNRCTYWSARLSNRPECTVSDPHTGKFALAVKIPSDTLPLTVEKTDEIVVEANGHAKTGDDAQEDGSDDDNMEDDDEDEEGSAMEEDFEGDSSQPKRTPRTETMKRQRSSLPPGKEEDSCVPTDTAIAVFDVTSPAPISVTSLPVRTEVAGIGFIGNGQDTCNAKSLFCFDSNMEVVTVPNWDDVENISEVTLQESTEASTELSNGLLGELVGAPSVRPEKSDMHSGDNNDTKTPLGFVEKAPLFKILHKYLGGSGATQALVTNVAPQLLKDLAKVVDASQNTNENGNRDRSTPAAPASPSTNVLNASLRKEDGDDKMEVDEEDDNDSAIGGERTKYGDVNGMKAREITIEPFSLYELASDFNRCLESDSK